MIIVVTEELFKVIKARLQRTDPQFVLFTKTGLLLDELSQRTSMQLDDLKIELIQAKYLHFIEKQLELHQGVLETRFCCYFIHPGGFGKAFVITFNGTLRIITVFLLGRRSLQKLKRRIYKK